jgi:hypothetical protein
MPRINPENLDLVHLEETVWVVVGEVDLPRYMKSTSLHLDLRRIGDWGGRNAIVNILVG